jgi:hypothetical protein
MIGTSNIIKTLIMVMTVYLAVSVVAMTGSNEPGAQPAMAISQESMPYDRHQVFVGDAPVVRVVVPATTSVVIDRPVAEGRSDPFPVIMPVFRGR